MKYLSLFVLSFMLAMLCISGCILFSTPEWIEPAVYGPDGALIAGTVVHPAETGAIDAIAGTAKAAGDAGVPFAGTLAWILGGLGTVGSYLVARNRAKKVTNGVVAMVDDLKAKVTAKDGSGRDLGDLVAMWQRDMAVAKEIKAAWTRTKGKAKAKAQKSR